MAVALGWGTVAFLNARAARKPLSREFRPQNGLFAKAFHLSPSVRVDWRRSLLITDRAVTNDEEFACDVYRATQAGKGERPCPPWRLGKGSLTFSAAFRALTGGKAAQQAAAWRKAVEDAKLHHSWRQYSPEGDLNHAPFRLLAVVFRPDLARDEKSGGEVRLVFCGYDESGLPLDFYAIFEFGVWVAGPHELKAWTKEWARLSQSPTNAGAVRLLVEKAISKSRSRRLRMNINVNENGDWHFLQFDAKSDGTLVPAANLTASPQEALGCSQKLTKWIVARKKTYFKEAPPVALEFGKDLAAQDLHYTDSLFWTPLSLDDGLRARFAISTCNGCHSTETKAPFAHVGKRAVGSDPELSGFLKGGNLISEHLLESRCEEGRKIWVKETNFADLERRVGIMETILNEKPERFGEISWTLEVH